MASSNSNLEVNCLPSFPSIFNWIKIRRTSWPTQNVYVSLLEEGPCQFGSMEWSVILLKYISITILPLRKRHEIIFQHFEVTLRSCQ